MRAIIPFLVYGAISCRDTAAPSGGDRATSETIIATIPDSGRDALWIMNPQSGDVLSRPVLPGVLTAATLSRDRRVLFANVVTVHDTTPTYQLVVLDVMTGQTQWTVPMWNGSAAGDVSGGIGLVTADYMGVAPDGHALYVGLAVKSGVYGLAAVDLASRHPVAYSGPWNIASGGLIPLPATPASPRGQLALLASRSGGGSRHGEQVYFLDPTTLAVADSISPAVLNGPVDEDLWQLAFSRDGRNLYLAGSTRIARYDLAMRQVTATATRPSTGAMTLMPDDSTIVFGDAGSWPDTPGSGFLFVMNGDLRLLDSIDVSTPVGGHPHSPTATVTGTATPSKDGHTLYFSAGSEQVGPLYPAQSARILVIDVDRRRLQRVIALRGYGRGLVFVGAGN